MSPPGSPNATLGGVSSYFCGLPSGCILGRSHPRQVCALCARRVGGSNPVRCPKCRQAVYCNDKCLNRHQPAHSQTCALSLPLPLPLPLSFITHSLPTLLSPSLRLSLTSNPPTPLSSPPVPLFLSLSLLPSPPPPFPLPSSHSLYLSSPHAHLLPSPPPPFQAASPAWVRRGSSRDHEAAQAHARSALPATSMAPPISPSLVPKSPRPLFFLSPRLAPTGGKGEAAAAAAAAPAATGGSGGGGGGGAGAAVAKVSTEARGDANSKGKEGEGDKQGQANGQGNGQVNGQGEGEAAVGAGREEADAGSQVWQSSGIDPCLVGAA
ncbi:unnamed protein product [Closterium sp. NIES-64]|nr:unnamed protein product [Closterium sp. NIES-64]